MNRIYIYVYIFIDFFSVAISVVESGDDLTQCQEEGTRTLILANHQSTADVPLFMACFNAKPDVLPNIMWIMDRVFKFTNFGIVSILHKDFFVQAVSVRAWNASFYLKFFFLKIFFCSKTPKIFRAVKLVRQLLII